MKQQQQKEKNLDFNFLSDKYNQLHEKIEKKPFKKIAFLGIAIGFGLMLGYQTISGIGGVFHAMGTAIEKSDAESLAAKNAEIAKMAKTIKAITPEEIKNFLAYMKVQQNIYDEKVALVSDSIVKAEREWLDAGKGGSFVEDIVVAERLNNDLTDHKKSVGDLITKHQNVYRSVANNDFKDLSVDDVKSFMTSFESYNANVTIHNHDLEKSINEKLFVDEEGNKFYVNKHNLLEKMKEIEKNMENATNSVKPKM